MAKRRIQTTFFIPKSPFWRISPARFSASFLSDHRLGMWSKSVKKRAFGFLKCWFRIPKVPLSHSQSATFTLQKCRFCNIGCDWPFFQRSEKSCNGMEIYHNKQMYDKHNRYSYGEFLVHCFMAPHFHACPCPDASSYDSHCQQRSFGYPPFSFYGFVFVNAICNEGDKVDSDYVNGNK